MAEYVCKFLSDENTAARRVYHADSLPTAMAMHNSTMPEKADRVLSWLGPTGITFQMHDKNMKL